MNRISQFLKALILVPAAALLGNWLGGWIRFYLTGQHVSTVSFTFTDDEGRNFKNTPVITKFYPGLLMAFAGRPRWFFALIGGVAAGTAIDDRYERLLWERFIAPQFTIRLNLPPRKSTQSSEKD